MPSTFICRNTLGGGYCPFAIDVYHHELTYLCCYRLFLACYAIGITYGTKKKEGYDMRGPREVQTD